MESFLEKNSKQTLMQLKSYLSKRGSDKINSMTMVVSNKKPKEVWSGVPNHIENKICNRFSPAINGKCWFDYNEKPVCFNKVSKIAADVGKNSKR